MGYTMKRGHRKSKGAWSIGASSFFLFFNWFSAPRHPFVQITNWHPLFISFLIGGFTTMLLSTGGGGSGPRPFSCTTRNRAFFAHFSYLKERKWSCIMQRCYCLLQRTSTVYIYIGMKSFVILVSCNLHPKDITDGEPNASFFHK